MNPENKKFLMEMINKFPVSVSTLDDVVMYHMMLPNEQALTICADTTIMEPNEAIIYYTIYVGDKLLEEAVVETNNKKSIDPVAKDIIQIMRLCSSKVMMQEAHLAHTKFMVHEIFNPKTYS